MPATFGDVYEVLRDRYPDPRERGRQFEPLVQKVLKTDRQYRDRYTAVWQWNEWPGRDGSDNWCDILGRTPRRPCPPGRRVGAARVGAEHLGGGRPDALGVLPAHGGSGGDGNTGGRDERCHSSSRPSTRGTPILTLTPLTRETGRCLTRPLPAYGFLAAGDWRIGTLLQCRRQWWGRGRQRDCWPPKTDLFGHLLVCVPGPVRSRGLLVADRASSVGTDTLIEKSPERSTVRVTASDA